MCIIDVKKYYIDIQSYITTSVKIFNLITLYLNGHANRMIWSVDCIKFFYTISASKLNSIFIYIFLFQYSIIMMYKWNCDYTINS